MKILFLILSIAAFPIRSENKFYDYIVVGSGSAGSVVANRLSEHSEIQVLLLEAGSRPNLLSEITALYPFLQNTRYDWNYTVQLPWYSDLGIERRPAHLPQGKALGGTSMINSMMYVRGNKLDYDNWEKKGASGWDWKSVFPYFLKSENNRNPEIAKNGFHGTRGEMYVQYPVSFTPLLDKYLKAAEELGFQTGDVNGLNQSVFTHPQITNRDGRRWGADKAFIYPAEGRKNFHLVTSAFVTKIIFNEKKVAIGVKYEHRDKIITVYARQEIIVSAGTVRSPQLLMLSGIGPSRDLKNFGISVISDLSVGENFQDHPMISLPLFEVANLSISEEDYKEFLGNGKGLLASLPTETIGYYSSKYSSNPEWPDSEIIFVTLLPSNYLPNPNGIVNCITLAERPKSRGKITLNSVDHKVPPIIDGKYLSDESDLKVLVEGIKMCLTLANTESLQSIGKRIDSPKNPACLKYPDGSDEYYACLVKHVIAPSYHIMGTCKMGNEKDPTTVVDPTLKVKGVKNLRVADASVVPEIVAGHPHALSVMIGEKAADLIYTEYVTKLKNKIPLRTPKII